MILFWKLILGHIKLKLKKAEAEKRDINKIVNVPTGLNDLKKKANDLDVGKLKTVSVDLKKLSDVVDNKVAKNKKLNTTKDISK